ncbi:ion transporter [Deinococcus sp. KNUC1210]|uniref:ion transporter n=1 Tax=Deinococcus sp. KNUC1210 TaxID=2917691 RepID=UPI001EF02CA9|nr:ion transporter [Deinococcus sp. KNUC1210]ULH15090.1 ion transporter [Deinococcus sp. KNUC1210]
MNSSPPRAHWRVVLGNIIFDNDTPAGRRFDLALIVAILLSISVVILDSVAKIHRQHDATLRTAELVLSSLFTAEYLLRLVSARHATHYARSFFGVVDLLSLLPAYISLFLPGSEYLLIVRALRLLRIFRILKMGRYLSEAGVLAQALRASAVKITVFLAVVLTLVLIIGALMYVIEGPQYGFTSIPTSIYWAIVTITTVGYGDISPHTALGKTLASITMIFGYGIIAVPTGIVTAGLTQASQPRPPAPDSRRCPRCGLERHGPEANYCQRCGERLPEAKAAT